jgi:uncharacterized protein YwgA
VGKDIEKLLLILKKSRVISGRTRFQKLVFLLENKDHVDMAYHFIPYHYGPYSSEMQIEIDMLEASNLIQVVSEKGNLYVHYLTKKGEKVASAIERRTETLERDRLFGALKQYKKKSTSSLIREAKQLANMPM